MSIDTSTNNQMIGINGTGYILPKKLKIWTCTQIAITHATFKVAGIAIPRVVAEETSVPPYYGLSLRLGSFSGELFDVRVYSGAASRNQVHEVGTRCAGPNDVATIKNMKILKLFLSTRAVRSSLHTCVVEHQVVCLKIPEG